MHLPHSAPGFQLRLGIVLPRAMRCFLTPIQFARMIDFVNRAMRIPARSQALLHERSTSAHGNNRTGSRPPELTGEADAVTSSHQIDDRIRAALTSSDFVGLFHLTIRVKHARRALSRSVVKLAGRAVSYFS
ncbi:hypothetical protein CCUS01_11396 [Colletotrichum cuscutae]|uniref:Uncharacterized protein n=1 Tax=Colletotrichum cuscutae TaxID=1209917 RepID=A0AAI9U384_9PEZI|nr:hypothetical protein CCUS01_11396 [Colletotrichum cuscutae]